MKLFLDSANLKEIEGALRRGFLQGITTNPSILSKEPRTDFLAHLQKIAALCRCEEQLLPLSVEVFTARPEEMYDQAMHLWEAVGYEQLNIKIPMGWEELEVIYRLHRAGIRVNCTCLFTEAQLVMAAGAGATYVSLFMGRLKDVGGDPLYVLRNARQLFDSAQCTAQIIVGSIRHARDITDAQLAGAHIVTAGAALFTAMCVHPQTTQSVKGFLADFEKWRQPIEALR